MRAFLVFAAFGSSAQGASLGPLAPVAEGKVQCFEPNEVARTCQSIGDYRGGGKASSRTSPP